MFNFIEVMLQRTTKLCRNWPTMKSNVKLKIPFLLILDGFFIVVTAALGFYFASSSFPLFINGLRYQAWLEGDILTLTLDTVSSAVRDGGAVL